MQKPTKRTNLKLGNMNFALQITVSLWSLRERERDREIENKVITNIKIFNTKNKRDRVRKTEMNIFF
jgi:hypothetical protein